MLWLKRNLFLVVSGTIALLLVGGAVFYLFTTISKNKTVEQELEQMKTTLDKLYRMDPFPEATNIATARKEVEKVQNAITQAKVFFSPIPVESVTGLEFKTLLDNTIFQLTRRAGQSSITLPEDPYFFSFAAQKKTLNLNPDSFPAITEQLAEVQTICNVLFDARVHGLTSLKRVRLTSDDPPGSRDYSDNLKIVTNQVAGAVLSPYEVSFTGFSTELASVLEGFIRSPHGFIVQAVKVEPFVEKEEEKAGPRSGLPPVFRPPPGTPPPPPPPPTENQTVLNEERFEATLLIAVVKPTR